MERLTQLSGGHYTVPDPDAAIERPGRWEDVYEVMTRELADTSSHMQALASQGREKSATYRQLFANKLTLTALLSRLDACL